MKIQRIVYNDIFSGILLIAISLFVIVDSLKFKDMFDSPGTIGPHVIPIIIAIILLFSGVIMIILTLTTKHTEDNPETIEKWYKNIKFVFGTTIIFIAIISMNFLGFILTSLFFIAGLSLLLGLKWWKSIVLSLFLTGTIYYLFGSLLRVPLPTFNIF